MQPAFPQPFPPHPSEMRQTHKLSGLAEWLRNFQEASCVELLLRMQIISWGINGIEHMLALGAELLLFFSF